MSRPSEAITAAVGSIVGAILIIVGAFTDAEIPPEVTGAIITLVSWIAALVTWYVAKQQRAGELPKAKEDGAMKTR
jgi:uncharacterized membrane protein YphA (DoxX/SURF4 family)